MNPLGANAWIWVSPLTERAAGGAGAARARLGVRRARAADRAARGLGSRACRGDPAGARPARLGLCGHGAGARAVRDRRRDRRVDAVLLEGVHRHRGGRRRRLDRRADLRVGRADLADDARRAEAVLRRAAREPGAARGARRRARRQGRDRAARPLRDERDQHHRAGARGHRRPPAGGLRAARRHLPRERGGEGLRRRVHAGRRPARARPRVGQRPRRAGRGPHRLARVPRRDPGRRLRRPDRDRVVHRRERDDRHGGVGLAAARRASGRHRRRRPRLPARSCSASHRPTLTGHGERPPQDPRGARPRGRQRLLRDRGVRRGHGASCCARRTAAAAPPRCA